MINEAKGRHFAICHKQESRLIKILGNIFNIQYIGANYCPLKKEDCNFHQTRSNAVVLYDTLPAEFIEEAVCMKTGEQIYQRGSERPRVALKANSQCESQDLLCQEARSSWETQSEVRSFQETGCNIVDNRIPGISLSTVQEQAERKRQTVAKLIEKFESHKYKEQFLRDMSQTQKIDRFSEASQRLLKDMNQTENLRAPREHSKASVPGLHILYGSWDHLLQMRAKSKVQSKPETKPRL